MAYREPPVIKVGCTVPASPEDVYRMFTNSTHLREWLADVAVASPQPGGRMYLAWDDGYAANCRFVELIPGKKVAFSWHGEGEPSPTRVEVTLRKLAKGTRVTVEHSGFGQSKKWQAAVKELTTGLESSMENLASVISTGHDLRFTRRPMLGIMISSEVETGGLQLGSVVAGMGAEAAGLRGGDIVVEMGGVQLKGWSSLRAALDGRHAGDTVEVAFHRNGKKQTTRMRLSGRPIPEVPQTAEALAKHARKLYADFDRKLAACFAGVSEKQAIRKPSSNEWSAKEVVAHLLDGEGDSHAFIAELVAGTERIYDGPFNNSDLRTAATAASYPSMVDMLAAFRRLESQTVDLLSRLPDSFVAFKPSYWRLAYGYTQAADHNEEHLDQIKAALAATR